MWYKAGVNSRISGGMIWRLAWWVGGSGVLAVRAGYNLVAPYPERWRRLGPHVSRWCRFAARRLRIQVQCRGALPVQGSLVAANHQGYIDILTIGGLFPTVFAARHDMRSWPVLGHLATWGGTIFINRDNRRAGARGVAVLTRALQAQSTVLVFPEGTGTDGTGVLPLRTGVFQAALDAGAPVVPAGVRYLSVDGEPVTAANHHTVGWYRGESFLQHLLRLGRYRCIEAAVEFGEALRPPHEDRRSLAERTEASLRNLLGLPPHARPVRSGRDDDP